MALAKIIATTDNKTKQERKLSKNGKEKNKKKMSQLANGIAKRLLYRFKCYLSGTFLRVSSGFSLLCLVCLLNLIFNK